jgi:cation transport protein ChaC
MRSEIEGSEDDVEPGSASPRPGFELTRQRLCDGTMLEALRAAPPAGVRMRSDAELEESLDAVFRARDPGEDVHVFGYGSLMWNPALEFTRMELARVHGWHRRFCVRMVMARGCPEHPGVMVALDRGGTCYGALYRIAAAKANDELRLLWRREMAAGSYEARWVSAVAPGRRLRAISFVANRTSGRYLGAPPVDEVAELIRTGRGPFGTTRAYFDALLAALDRLGIEDAGMQRLRHALERAERGDSPRRA